MTALAPAVFAVVVLVFVAQSRRFDRLHLTAPIVFSIVGAALARTVLTGKVDATLVRTMAELTLALILFHDAAQVQPRQLRPDAGLCSRLLLVGLPLTVLAGLLAARVLFPPASPWLPLLLAAAVAPTDAGLGAATVLNPTVPVRVRRILNVESGLNDGLVTPVVLFAVAATGSPSGAAGGALVGALRELAVGLLVGIVLGALSGRVLSHALGAGWVMEGMLPIATLVVPLLTYYGSIAVGGNGFVAAFVSGTAFATAATRPSVALADRAAAVASFALPESVSLLLGYAVWTLFGAVAVAHFDALLSWRALVFAVLALTVLRMGPVALALLGSRLRLRTVLFVGWFGPRGLASVVFGLLASESLSKRADLQPILGAIATTVFLSVVVHGVTAGPWAGRYGAWAQREQPAEELAGYVEPIARSLGTAPTQPDSDL